MANLAVLDAAGATKYIKADGAGDNGDPHVYRMGSGATDDAAAAGELYPLAGLYQESVDEIDSGDVGRVRMSRRRAVMTAGDFRMLTLTGSDPVPSGSDIVMRYAAAVAVADMQIRNTNPHDFLIPMAMRGWRNLAVFLRSASAFDQEASVEVYGWTDTSSSGRGKMLSVTLPAMAAGAWIAPAAGAGAGLGETVGAATIVTGMLYGIPAFHNSAMPYIGIRVLFSVAPTTGELELIIVRST